MKRKYKILTSQIFIVGLFILAINDFLLKESFGNWITGKLSDFSGLFVFAIFWMAIFPKYKLKIILSIALIFIFWKTRFSEIFIDSWNSVAPFYINRIVDLTDLIALIILPFAIYIFNRKEKLKSIQIHPILPILISCFLFVATSAYTDIETEKEYFFPYSKDSLEYKIRKLDEVSVPLKSYGEFPKQNEVKPEDENISIDSLNLFIKEDFCFDGYEAKIIISGNNKSAKLQLIGFHHRCPKDGKELIISKERNDKEILENSFYSKVIEKLLN